jgi:hypothetical protein
MNGDMHLMTYQESSNGARSAHYTRFFAYAPEAFYPYFPSLYYRYNSAHGIRRVE